MNSLAVIFIGSFFICAVGVQVMRSILLHTKTSHVHTVINVICVIVAALLFTIWLAAPFGIGPLIYIIPLAIIVLVAFQFFPKFRRKPKSPLKRLNARG